MATQYINKNKEIVFLNNKNIAHERGNLDDGTIAYNAIPSLSLFNDTYNEVTGYTNNVELSAYGISCIVSSLSAAISNEVSSAEKRAKEYTEQLSGEFRDISVDLRGAVTVLDKQGKFIGNDLSVRKLTNDEYNQLVYDEQTAENMIYIINDNYYSARNQKIRDLGEPYLSSDAVTKNYVDITENSLSIATYNEAKAYANSISSEPLLSANDYSDRNFAKYNDFDFSYVKNEHALILKLKNNKSETKELSVDATDFIANGIIHEMHVNSSTNMLVITWKKPTGAYEEINIPLEGLFTLYKTTDQGGIDIKNTPEGFVISCNNSIARITDLEGYQVAGNYITDSSLGEALNQLSTSLSSYYIAKDKNSTTASGIYTTYTIDQGHNGGIRLDSPSDTIHDRTAYGYEGINVTRDNEDNTEYFKFFNDADGNKIARLKDIDAKYQEIINQNYIKKSDFYNKIKTITSSSTFSDVIQVLLDLQALTNVE